MPYTPTNNTEQDWQVLDEISNHLASVKMYPVAIRLKQLALNQLLKLDGDNRKSFGKLTIDLIKLLQDAGRNEFALNMCNTALAMHYLPASARPEIQAILDELNALHTSP